MLHAFWLVVLDLWYFVRGRSPALAIESGEKIDTHRLLALPAAALIEVPTQPHHSPKPDVLAALPGSAAYVTQPQVDVLRSPYLEFDGVVAKLSYGDAVQVHSYSGRYARVLSKSGEGWVEKDSLTDNRSLVWPQLYEGKVYLAQAPETMALRLHLDDAFCCSALHLPLQSTEYVSYRLLQEHRLIPWPSTRPREAGAWQRILRGVTGIHLGVRPLSGSVIEYTGADGVGALGYVESVTPDESIVVTAVGNTEAGVYTSTLYHPQEWREFRPVFLEVR